MNKIQIPSNADCFRSNYGALNYHVCIWDDAKFEKFCKDNNIGHEKHNRKDIVKSYKHIFTRNVNVFSNWPDNTKLVS